MRRDLFAIGDRSLSGEYGRVFCIGALKGESAQIRRLFSVGDTALRECRIGKGRMTGGFSLADGAAADLAVTGGADFQGVCRIERLKCCGNLTAELLECRLLCCGAEHDPVQDSSSLRWSGAIRTETLEYARQVALNCDLDCKNLLLSAEAAFSGEIACENFFAFAPFTGEMVNAETIFFYPFSGTSVDAVVGSRIVAGTALQPELGFSAIPKYSGNRPYSRCRPPERGVASAGEIEGDQVELTRVRAERVSGGDVVIGELCVIGQVRYRNSIQISDRAAVGEVIRE
ncbi:MAG: hypothetical protein ACOX64_01405 [Candidatus Merdivicinus sp.]|jgi:hypothetical protein